MRFQIGVFATITDSEGRVLLVHRTDCDWWCQPGGGLEHGESPWQGVVREVREETGLAQPGRSACLAASPVLRWLPSAPTCR